uniref:hypothetical protein n=1 Tax=uncultured Dysgonomonas sp. TaxID=206096 RepID=UPI0026153149|nr:hypothetical protein [uncultured Dysgonomonas sp.]
MNTRNIDFGYLIEQMYIAVGETHSQVLERYEDHPLCLMEYKDNGDHGEHIRVDFDEQKGSVTYFFDKDKVLELTSLCLYQPSDIELFIVFLLRYADYYDYIRNHWVINNFFYLKAVQEDYCTHFICCKLKTNK